MKNLRFFLVFLFCVPFIGISQTKFKLQNNKKSDKVRFKLINNLVVIPVQINGVDLSFILDTGVSKPIVFSFLNEKDTLKINNTEAFILRGLGEGDAFEALKSRNNVFKIGEAVNLNQEIYAIHDASLNFTPQLGVPIHGIIGFDIFKDFVVEINYGRRFIKLHHPNEYVYKACESCETVNFEFYNNKPYINAQVKLNDTYVPVKLLVDSGGSDSMWIFEDENLGLYENENYFIDFLGNGLSGSVYGKRAKIQELKIRSFTLKQVNVSYPDSSAIHFAKRLKIRNGSVSGNVLKRFNMIVDYRNARLTLKKNRFYKDEFSYNKSGIELEHHGELLVVDDDNSTSNAFSDTTINLDLELKPSYNFEFKPAYTIVELRENSPAQQAGLLVGDIVLSVNNRRAHDYKIHEIIRLFYAKEGDDIRIKVTRNGVIKSYSFQLKAPLK
ncbi:aspartyl protease family protein [Formosa sp. 4Alg 33]|uniref:aspartyl protease family protein n=1 Tax=Formosa sp. 4Alg 33 TaxID=3382189 RepID=UPI003D9C333A